MSVFSDYDCGALDDVSFNNYWAVENARDRDEREREWNNDDDEEEEE